MTDARRLIVGVTDAIGMAHAPRLLEVLRAMSVETHLVVTRIAEVAADHGGSQFLQELGALADRVYPIDDMGAAIASGSFRTSGMIVAPCSAGTVTEIATGAASNLLTCAAGACLKEQRRLVLVMGEAPLQAENLQAMLAVTEMGAIILPPVPAISAIPMPLEDVLDFTIGRALDLFDIPFPRAEIGRARRRLVSGQIAPHLDDALNRVSAPGAQAAPAMDGTLTPREREVLKWAAVGRSNREIAATLSIGERTVKFHVRNVLIKLRASTRAHAVAVALHRGLIEP